MINLFLKCSIISLFILSGCSYEPGTNNSDAQENLVEPIMQVGDESTLTVSDLQKSRQIEIQLDAKEYNNNDDVHFTIANHSEFILEFGVDSSFETLVDGTWYSVVWSKEINVIDIAYVVKPGEEFNNTWPTKYLVPGEYRLVKSIDLEGDSSEEIYLLSDNFIIVQ